VHAKLGRRVRHAPTTLADHRERAGARPRGGPVGPHLLVQRGDLGIQFRAALIVSLDRGLRVGQRCAGRSEIVRPFGFRELALGLLRSCEQRAGIVLSGLEPCALAAPSQCLRAQLGERVSGDA
jgi:hypothetical protein